MTSGKGASLLATSLLSVVLLSHSTDALRRFTATETKAARALHAKAGSASANNTAYGEPIVELRLKPTAINHFSAAQYSRNTSSLFNMRYVLVWPTAQPTSNSPIYLFCGQESDLITGSGVGTGFYSDLANSTGAIQVWPEHRYYSSDPRYVPTSGLTYLTIEQALVDHIELVLYVQNALNMTRNPVIALGSSYSGQLAQYLRMRYPDVIAGAISSSATSLGCPGLGLDPSYDPYAFGKVATRSASTEGGSAAACAGNVRKFFQTIMSDNHTTSGYQQINNAMSLCSDSQMGSASDVLALANYVLFQWVSASQFNSPVADLGTAGVPGYRVRVACQYLSDASLSGSTLLSNMVSALNVFNANASTTGGCLDITESPTEPESEPPGTSSSPSASSSYGVNTAAPEAAPTHEEAQQTEKATPQEAEPELSADDIFGYQVCNQDQTPTSYDGVTDMFFSKPYDLDGNDKTCVQTYGIHAQYDWAAYNFGLAALRQSSNIFFTNGNYDPFIACGATVNISSTIIASVYEGCHACDFGEPDPADTASVKASRQQGQALITQWVQQYNTAKTTIPLSNPANLFGLAYNLGGYISPVDDTLPGSTTQRNASVLQPSAKYSNSINAMI